ncbi:hypothetical protein VAE151_530026 [Vibrio aestuarianus]|uniref:Uncharacterized protein n=1 Tax=Vibrio aestuarianus TaxID=28171 RepID=A0ABN8TU60_9VIBR|nr:hypothetical protein VAE308_1010497 [Vibrio aestuarianus]CAH8188943.1 hypothetical protein VAE032_250027 [Vibrio aestuarianus]CAH8189084.1 hypothetical protein VAE055_350027 [Vibrio aestuarianus]CAH8189228.1 hypothetical protein VAE128_440499 [Vibrio aestuarianus]CAH8189431.1 hypothetical protein VAE130_550503 [Vibrio aestuarianus]
MTVSIYYPYIPYIPTPCEPHAKLPTSFSVNIPFSAAIT